jgi:hypothetical protein
LALIGIEPITVQTDKKQAVTGTNQLVRRSDWPLIIQSIKYYHDKEIILLISTYQILHFIAKLAGWHFIVTFTEVDYCLFQGIYRNTKQSSFTVTMINN